jgi:serine/threonine protein kinase
MNKLTSLSRYQVGVLQRSTETADLYLGKDTVLNRSVCLRVFKESRVGDARLRNQLTQSLQRATELVHPHIAWIWETGEEDGILFSAERSLSGVVLSERIPNEHRLSWEEAFQYFRHLCQAVQFAHARKMIHGDVSMSNVLLSEDHGAVLMGFGIAPVFAGSVLAETYDQAGLARLFLSMLTGRTEAPAVGANAVEWPFSVPPLARGPIMRGLGLHTQGYYFNVEEFFESVEEQASLPQPDLPPAEIARMQAEADAYEKLFEAAVQAREDVRRQEALAAARKEIGDEIQKALDEHLSMDEEVETHEQPAEVEPNVVLVQETSNSPAESEPNPQARPSQIPEVAIASGGKVGDNPKPIRPEPGKNSQGQKPPKKRRNNLLYFTIVLLVLVILAVLVWLWYEGIFSQLFTI